MGTVMGTGHFTIFTIESLAGLDTVKGKNMSVHKAEEKLEFPTVGIRSHDTIIHFTTIREKSTFVPLELMGKQIRALEPFRHPSH